MELIRRLTWPLYLVALLFIITPIVDVVANIWPFEVANSQWRFGSAGIASNYLVSGLFGLAMTGSIAAAAGHRWVLKTVGAVSLFAAAIFVLVTMSYVLDVLQLRNVVRDQAAQLFKFGAVKSLFKFVTTTAVLVVLGIETWRATNQPPVADKPTGKPRVLLPKD